MQNYPIVFGNKPLTAEHYAVLTDQEACMLSRITQDKVFYGSDLDAFIKSCAKLQNIDPTLKCTKDWTNTIKLYPSFDQRALCFYNAQGDTLTATMATLRSTASLMGIINLLSERSNAIYHRPFFLRQYDSVMADLFDEKDRQSKSFLEIRKASLEYQLELCDMSYLSCIKKKLVEWAPFALVHLVSKYPSYKHDLKTIITNQQPLTNSLEKLAIKKEKK